ncbi:MAG: hypothetical protein L6R35_007346, partial [Caloplaca aegaea]
VTFTGVIVSVNQVSHNLSNYLPPGAAEKFTPEEHENAVYGSKFVLVLEEFMLANTWLCKACLLILYHQMTWVLLPCQSFKCRPRESSRQICRVGG